MTLPYFDLFFLSIVFIACVIHINENVQTAWCLRLGYAMIIGGCAGSGLEWFWPDKTNYWADLIMHAGMAFVAVGLTRDKMRDLATFIWRLLTEDGKRYALDIVSMLKKPRVK